MNPVPLAVLNTSKAHPRGFSDDMVLRASNCTQGFTRTDSAYSHNFVLWDFVCAVEPLRRLDLPVMALKHDKATVTHAETQNPASFMLDNASRLEHHHVHHRPDTTTFGRVVHPRVGITERVLPNQAQRVHGHSSKLTHQIVGVKLARRQPLQIHVRLQLRTELLMGGVIAIQRNDVSRAELHGQRSRPAVQNILGQQQNHITLVAKPQVHDGALGEAIDPAHRIGLNPHVDQVLAFLLNAFARASAKCCHIFLAPWGILQQGERSEAFGLWSLDTSRRSAGEFICCE